CSRPHRYLPSFPTRRSSDLVLASITSDRYRPVGALAPGGPVASRAMKRPRMVIRNTLTRAEPGTWSPGVAEVSALARVAGLVYRSEEHTSELQSRFDLVCRL